MWLQDHERDVLLIDRVAAANFPATMPFASGLATNGVSYRASWRNSASRDRRRSLGGHSCQPDRGTPAGGRPDGCRSGRSAKAPTLPDVDHATHTDRRSEPRDDTLARARGIDTPGAAVATARYPSPAHVAADCGAHRRCRRAARAHWEGDPWRTGGLIRHGAESALRFQVELYPVTENAL